MRKANKLFVYWQQGGLRNIIRHTTLYVLERISVRIKFWVSRLKNAIPANSLPPLQATVLQKNKSVRNLYKGERCFVIGAGPSLKHLDLKLLADEYYFGVNAVYLNKQLPNTGKGFWCTIDTFVKPFIDMADYSIPWLKALEASTSKDMKYFFPVQGHALCREHGLFTDRQVYYLAFGSTIGTVDPDLSYVEERLDLSVPLISPHNIIETAITCAAYMGFREIYLLGCDSDWFMYDNLDIKHFYSHDPNGLIETRKGDEQKKDYFVMNTREKKLYYGFLLYRNYRLLKEALNRQGIQVFNASGGGMLDVFPVVKYESLFSDH